MLLVRIEYGGMVLLVALIAIVVLHVSTIVQLLRSHDHKFRLPLTYRRPLTPSILRNRTQVIDTSAESDESKLRVEARDNDVRESLSRWVRYRYRWLSVFRERKAFKVGVQIKEQ